MDQFDVTPEDPDLLREIELLTRLMVEASSFDRHLTPEEIDRLLQVPRHRD